MLLLLFERCDAHGVDERVVEVARKEGFAQLAQVELEHAGDGVHLARTHGHERIEVVALLERLLELVDLELRARYAKDALIVEAQAVDGAHTARDDGRYVVLARHYVLDQLAAEEARLADHRRLADLLLQPHRRRHVHALVVTVAVAVALVV